MASRKSTTAAQNVTEIIKVERGTIEMCVVGTSPIILNKMSAKARQQLLLPRGRKTATEKAVTLKHDPMAEYRGSVYVLPDGPTMLAVLATSFKGAMSSAALDMPGAKKTQIGRLTHVNGDYVALYGVPQLSMSIVRSADINRTPDVRTRAIVPRWACRLSVTYTKPLITPQAVVNLIAAGGIYIGVGDWRPEKGKGNYGQYEIVDAKDARFLAIIKEGGRKAQQSAMEMPECYDEETAELLGWYDEELGKRKLQGVA